MTLQVLQLDSAAPPWTPKYADLRGPFSTTLFVDNVRGSDDPTTGGRRGDISRPFLTIQAALNAMLTDDLVQFGPQVFAIAAQLTVPATVIRGQVAGYKTPPLLSSAATPGCTIISSAVANAWELGANLGLARWLMTDLIHSGNKIISADGSVAPYAKDTFLVSGLYMTNCVGFVTTKYATQVVMQDHGVGNYVFTGNGTVQIIAMEGSGGNFTLTWDAADALTTTANNGLQILAGSQIGAITMAKQAHLTVDEVSRVSTISGSGGLNVSGASVPSISCCGYLNNVDFATAGSELPDTATALTVDFRGARFYYSDRVNVVPATVLKWKVGGAGANPQSVKLDGSQTLPGCAITADVNINISCRGASMPGTTFATPGATGTILPPNPYVMTSTAIAGTTQAVAFGFRTGVTNYAVTYSSDNAASVPTGVVTSKTSTGFNVGVVAAGGGNVDCVVNFR